MSAVQVYALRIDRELSSAERAALLEILPYSRRQRLIRTREDKQIQALCAYGALHLALARQYDFYGFPPILIAEGGKPYFPDYPAIQFNLSHTDGAVVCALHATPVGVDLERNRPPADNILHYYHFTKGRDFWEMWVHREAIAKYHGRGFAALAHWDDALEQGVTCRPLALLDGYYAALATATPYPCVVHSVSLEEISDAAARR